MGITSIGFSLLFVGIPAFAGSYLVVTHFGQAKVSNGISILIFALVAGGLLAFYAGEGPLSGESFAVASPSTLITGILLGAVAGFITRNRRKK